MEEQKVKTENLNSDLFERKLEEIVAKVQNLNTEEKKENETFSLVSLEKKIAHYESQHLRMQIEVGRLKTKYNDEKLSNKEELRIRKEI